LKSFDETGSLDIEFFKYSEGSGSESAFTGITPIIKPSEGQAGSARHNYMLVNSERNLNLNDSNVIKIQSYFVSALSSLLH